MVIVLVLCLAFLFSGFWISIGYMLMRGWENG